MQISSSSLDSATFRTCEPDPVVESVCKVVSDWFDIIFYLFEIKIRRISPIEIKLTCPICSDINARVNLNPTIPTWDCKCGGQSEIGNSIIELLMDVRDLSRAETLNAISLYEAKKIFDRPNPLKIKKNPAIYPMTKK